MLSGKKILLGVSGSIAAYKAVYLTRLLVKAGAQVQVVITKSAEDFVTPLTFSTLSKSTVYKDLSDETGWNNHVELGLWADLFLIAPATANSIAKFANGTCADMLSAVYLSARCPVMVAPAMDEDMWKHQATRRNIKQLTDDGVQIVPVNTGELASGLVGPGRMAEPEEILIHLESFFKKKSDWRSITALVTAGPTFEDIDPVRFIGNRSSGKMGIAVAEAIAGRGATVHLIIGPTEQRIPSHKNIMAHQVRSSEEMATEAGHLWPSCQLAVLAAAVADYRPAVVADQKIKKDGNTALQLVRTRDIAMELSETKQETQVTVGFALESENAVVNAKSKLSRKRFDFIVLNSLEDRGAGFQGDTNKVTFLFPEAGKTEFELKRKTEVAEDIVVELEKILKRKNLLV